MAQHINIMPENVQRLVDLEQLLHSSLHEEHVAKQEGERLRADNATLRDRLRARQESINRLHGVNHQLRRANQRLLRELANTQRRLIAEMRHVEADEDVIMS